MYKILRISKKKRSKKVKKKKFNEIGECEKDCKISKTSKKIEYESKSSDESINLYNQSSSEEETFDDFCPYCNISYYDKKGSKCDRIKCGQCNL